MGRPCRRDFYAAMLAKYDDTVTLVDIAKAENITLSALSAAVVAHKLRGRAKRVRAESDDTLIRQLIGDKTDDIVAAGIVSAWTVRDWRFGRGIPSLARFRAVAEANGLRLALTKESPLQELLDRLNALRQQDLSGAEICAALTDDILDLLGDEI